RQPARAPPPRTIEGPGCGRGISVRRGCSAGEAEEQPVWWGRGRRAMRLFAQPLMCQQLVELVTDYFEGKLSWSDRRRFRAHITGCDHCTDYLEQMRLVIEATGRLTEDDLEPHAREELLVAFLGWREGRAAYASPPRSSRSMQCMYWVRVRVRRNRWSTRCRAASPIRSASEGSSSRPSIARAAASRSVGSGRSTPESPSSI